jgi:hypothetical protein
LNMWMISSNLYFRCVDMYISILIKLYTERSDKMILLKIREKDRKHLKQKLPTNT